MSDLREALTDLISLCERKLYPQPDKPNSDWMRVQAAKAALAQPQNDAEACGYAERLAVALWEKHYKNASPQWKPLTGDLIGILTQIDNMIAGLAPQIDADITDPPDWLWWGKLGSKDVVTFGRWPKNGACWRYKLADIQPTEHDHPTAPPPSSRMREALDEDPLADRLLGRASFLRDRGEIKSPELMEKAAQTLRAGDNHASDGKESEGGPLNWKLSEDAKARIAEIDNNRRNAAINASNIVAGNLPSDDLGAPLERIRTEAARMGYALVPNDREAIARIVYSEFPFVPTLGCPSKPVWVEDGNSFMQEDARRAADAILALRGGE